MSNGDMILLNLNLGDLLGFIGYCSHEESDWEINSTISVVYIVPTFGMFVLGLYKNTLPIDSYWEWTNDNLGLE